MYLIKKLRSLIYGQIEEYRQSLVNEKIKSLTSELLKGDKVLITYPDIKIRHLMMIEGRFYGILAIEPEDVVKIIKQEAEYTTEISEQMQIAKLTGIIAKEEIEEEPFKILG